MAEDKASTSSSSAEISVWLDRVKKQHPLARFELHKVGFPDPVMSWPAKDSDPAELAADVHDLAETEGRHTAGSSSGRVAFRLRAVSDVGMVHAQKMFNVEAAPEGRGVDAPGDFSHMMGSGFQQLLKANNDLIALNIRSNASRDEAWQAQNAQLLEQNITLRKEHYEVLRAWQKHVLLESEQKRLTAQLEQQEVRDKELLEGFRMVVPILANRLAGGGRGKGAPAAQAMLDAVIAQFTPAQIEWLTGDMSRLSDQQKLLLYELFDSFKTRKMTPLNGAADANGANGGEHGTP